MASSDASMSGRAYDLIVVGSGFAGSMATLNFLEGCKSEGKSGRVALVEVGRADERLVLCCSLCALIQRSWSCAGIWTRML